MNQTELDKEFEEKFHDISHIGCDNSVPCATMKKDLLSYLHERDEKVRRMTLEGMAKEVTRIEVIDGNGRAYVRWGVKVAPHLQDEGRTMKIFVENLPTPLSKNEV